MWGRDVYIMWYHGLFGNSKKAKKALEYYGSFERLYEVVKTDTDTEGLLNGFKRTRLSAYSLLDASESIECARDLGGDIITFESEYYPKELLGIKDFPMLLFYEGDKEVLKEKLMVAVVGSRDASHEALSVSYNAAYCLAGSGAVIVSGAARGVDVASHKGAVAAGGATVGVLGCGLGSPYMDRLGGFYDKMCKNGVFITEMLPLERPSRYSFPERNRIISGMSRAVLVSFAGEKSGALITAENAKKQKRRVYAVPPEIFSSDGCKKLLADGAEAFYKAGDIILPYKELVADKFNSTYCEKSINGENVPEEAYSVAENDADEPVTVQKKTVKKKDGASRKKAEKEEKKQAEKKKNSEPLILPDFIGADAVKIYGLLSDNKTDINSLVPLTGLPVRSVLAAISELEIFGFVKSLPGAMVEKTGKR